ncbi:ATP-binding protein [Streptomyces sp. NPDC050704]|uniref:ATP-binding protein n=1 Tax=Streptomyces sp. NPDC050704 TaxID=3157219 RepID=UPI00342009A3
MDCTAGLPRKPWDLPFVAEPEEVAGLRRIMRLHLELWGLPEVIDAAQLCVSELVSNVITHVGLGTPTTLTVAMNGTHLRIEIHDPDSRALPTLLSPDLDAETGRGMALIGAVADRWGVQLLADRKVTWCELSTSLTAPNGHSVSPRVARVEKVLDLYRVATPLHTAADPSRLNSAKAEAVAIDVIADLLHWLRAYGRNADGVLDRAQTHFEAEAGLAGESL